MILDDDAEWWAAFGSLPAQLGPAELTTLNMGLRYLFKELGEAQTVYAAGQHLDGSYLALVAVVAFIGLFAKNAEIGLAVPLHRLLDALDALDNGIIDPLVKPTVRAGAGRPKAPTMRATFKGAVAFTVHRLRDFGVALSEAQAVVADDLRRIGVKPDRGNGGRMSARTVRGWCGEIAEDLGRHGEAAKWFDRLAADPRNAIFDRMPPETAVKALRLRLTHMARTLGQKAS